MKIRLFYIILSAFLSLPLVACSDSDSDKTYQMHDITEYNINTSDMGVRDPFIIVDRENECYYLIRSAWTDGRGALYAYKSLNLKKWKDVGYVFQAEPDYLGTKDYWAPDYYEYKGNWYCFITVGGEDIIRGTTILKGGSHPLDTYKPILPNDQLNITPIEMMSLDGSLYVDKQGVPYMLFCREWLQVQDGEMWAMQLKDDLSGAADEPFLLFSASQAPWTVSGDGFNYVTDAPFIWKDEESGNLIMIWSSGSTGGYAIGQSISKNGKLEGPWEHDPLPIFSSDGGHAMIFYDLEDNLKMAYHAPNSGAERVQISDVSIKDGKFERFDPSEYNPVFNISSKPFEVVYQNIPAVDADWAQPVSSMFDGDVNTGWTSLFWEPTEGTDWSNNTYVYPADAIYPPYVIVIDMKRNYAVEQVNTMVRTSNDLWDDKIRDLEYWVSNSDLPENPEESDFNDTAGWVKIGSANFPVSYRGYRTTDITEENGGRYLKIVVTDLHFPGNNEGAPNHLMGLVGFKELNVRGHAVN